jgi:hypothetical protein
MFFYFGEYAQRVHKFVEIGLENFNIEYNQFSYSFHDDESHHTK